MIQIAYQPAYDPFHTIFRVLRLLDHFSVASISVHTLRILDFYFLFPFYITSIRLTPQLRRLARVGQFDKSRRPYSEQPAPPILFRTMQPIHEAALQTLVLSEFLTREDFVSGVASRSSRRLSGRLSSRISELNGSDITLLTFLSSLHSAFPLEGRDGLKHRTGLSEHRYDVV